jgi:hypothetical protein
MLKQTDRHIQEEKMVLTIVAATRFWPAIPLAGICPRSEHCLRAKVCSRFWRFAPVCLGMILHGHAYDKIFC